MKRQNDNTKPGQIGKQLLQCCFFSHFVQGGGGGGVQNWDEMNQNLTLSSFFILHCHSFKSHFNFFNFILSHASLPIILSNSKLLWKLHQYGIRGNALSWIRAFLGNRSQTVVLEGEESGSVPVTSGVPQGSVLGPILFLVYINDLPEELSSQVRLFADDMAMYLTVGGSDDEKVLQQDLDRLSVWEDQWDMEFNPSKCQVVQVTTSKTVINSVYTLHGQILEVVTSTRYLGVDISDGISWNSHIDRMTGNANRTLGYIKRNIKTQNKKVRETAYNTLVRPQLEYASPVWDPNSDDKTL